MIRTAFAIALCLPSAALAQNHLMDNHQTVTYDCGKDAVTNIMGNDNTVKLVGACDAVHISGNHNTLAGDQAKSLDVSGNDNTLAIQISDTVHVSGDRNALTWKPTSDPAPKVTVTGRDNKLGAATPAPPKPTR